MGKWNNMQCVNEAGGRLRHATVPSIGTDVQYSRFHGVGCNVMGVWDTVGAGSVGPIHTCRHTV